MRDVNLLADTLASLPQHLDLFIAHKQHILFFFNLLFVPSFKFRLYQRPSLLVKNGLISTDPSLLSVAVLLHSYSSRLRLRERALNLPVRAELPCISPLPILS